MILNYFTLNRNQKISNLRRISHFENDSIVLGNGPSLKKILESKIDFLSNKDLYVVNDFSLSPYFNTIKPNFYVIVDPAYWFPDKLNESKKSTLFNISNVSWKINLILPIDAKRNLHSWFNNNSFINIYYFPNLFFRDFSNLPFFYKSCLFNPRIQNVLVYALFVAINNSHKNIYLLGAEHSWFNNLHVDESNTVCALDEHFYESDVKIEPYLTWYGEKYKLHQLLFDFGRMFRGYHELDAYSKRRGAKIVNLTKNSFIDAFDKINF